MIKLNLRSLSRFSIGLFLIILSITNCTNISEDEKGKKINPPPQTQVVIEKDESGEWRNRLEWIDQMHKCDSSINWRTINYNVRLEKAEQRKIYSNSKSGTVNIEDILFGYWRETGSNNLAGRTHYTEYDPEIDSIYCATSGGNIWKANLNGNGWRVLNDGFKIDDIKMIRKIGNFEIPRLLVASGGWGVPSFYYSDDDGQTWTASTGLNNIADWGTVIKAVVADDAIRTIYLLAMEWNYDEWEKQTSLYVSVNAGVSFVKKKSWLESEYGSEESFDIWCDREGQDCYIFFSDAQFVIDNEDFSVDYVGQPTITNPGNVMLSGCETETETYLYLGLYSDNYTEFYQSADGGLNWSKKGSVDQSPFMKNSLIVSQKYPNTLYYGGVECYRSTDGGENWTRINEWWEYYDDIANLLHADIPGINSYINAENNEFVYINTDGGTYISNDQLQTVQNISMLNHNIGQFYSVYSHRTNSNYIFAGSQDQGYQLCNTNSGSGSVEFTQILSGDYGHLVSGDGGNSLWMVYPGFAAYYPSATASAYDSYWWEFECSGQFWIPPLMSHPVAPNICYLGGGTTGSGTHIFEMIYSLGNVIANELAYDFSGNTGATAISAMAYSPLNTDYRYVMNGNGEFFSSTNGGNTWTINNSFDGPDGNYLYGAAIVPSTETLGVVYVAGSGYSNPPVYKSDNNGVSFSSMSSGMPSTMVYEMVATSDDKYLFASTDAGPYVFIKSENQWYDLAQNQAPDQTYWTVDFDLNTETVRFGTYGRGIWDFKITQGLVENEEVIAKNIEIYPNPASNIINIDGFEGVGFIYTIYGKKVKEIHPGTIDISDLAPGVYFVKTVKFSANFIKVK
ncbi:MAG: T9SS type A sorting domain-containing protein [Bacteroidales bacterium]|nr:T9SS type A sorting domain-containing protein [Bacteroidales bacterium]